MLAKFSEKPPVFADIKPLGVYGNISLPEEVSKCSGQGKIMSVGQEYANRAGLSQMGALGSSLCDQILSDGCTEEW